MLNRIGQNIKRMTKKGEEVEEEECKTYDVRFRQVVLSQRINRTTEFRPVWPLLKNHEVEGEDDDDDTDKDLLNISDRLRIYLNHVLPPWVV